MSSRWQCPNCNGWIAWWVAVHTFKGSPVLKYDKQPTMPKKPHAATAKHSARAVLAALGA